MLCQLRMDGVEELAGALGGLAWEAARVGPDGEELRGEMALPGCFKIEVAAGERAGQVVVVVEEALGRVGMGIDDEGGAVQGGSGRRQVCCHDAGHPLLRIWDGAWLCCRRWPEEPGGSTQALWFICRRSSSW